MIVKYGLESIWKEVVMGHQKVLSQHCLELPKKTMKILRIIGF
jgi:hypothetical protein